MEYLKYFLRFTEDVNTNRYNIAKEEDTFEYQPAISFEEIEKLKAHISEMLKPLGIRVIRGRYMSKEKQDKPNNVPIRMCQPRNVAYYYLRFDFYAHEMDNSILGIIYKQCIVEQVNIVCTDENMPPRIEYRDIMFCNAEIDNDENCYCTIDPKTESDAYPMVLNKLIELTNTFSDDSLFYIQGPDDGVRWTSSEAAGLKNIILMYLKNLKSKLPTDLFNSHGETVTSKDFYKAVYDYILTFDLNHKIFAYIKQNNRSLFNNLIQIDPKIGTSGSLGELGF